MNVQLKDITVTARDGRVSHLDQVYIRGSHVRFFIVPDMLRLAGILLYESDKSCLSFHLKHFLTSASNRNAPMFRSRGVKGRGVGLARGRATVSRARASGRGAPRGA
jgi:small nuclear ribonucleoprotein D3